ncbi:MAG: hypothetical protein WCE30_17760 [Mycobacterium sp.]
MTDIADYERQVMRVLGPKLHERLQRASDADINIEDLFGDPEQVAEKMAASLPASHAYDDISGPFYDTAGLSRWLGISRQAVHQKVAKHTLLACPTADGGNVYPTWQFLSNGATIPALADVLTVLAGGTDDAWMIALWMQAPSELLDGDRASDWLRKGGDPKRVMTLARDTASRWKV